MNRKITFFASGAKCGPIGRAAGAAAAVLDIVG
jgi:hypothetical protein